MPPILKDSSVPDTRVLIDATALPADKGGVGRYIEGLLGALDHTLPGTVVVCQHRDAANFGAAFPNLVIKPIAARYAARGLRLLWEQIGLPLLVSQIGASVLHSPHYTMPLFGRFRRVVTLHDATFFSDPKLHSPLKASFFKIWSKVALRQADTVIVPSASTAKELERYAGRTTAVVHVAHHGVDFDIFHPPTAAEAAAFTHRMGISGRPYIAFLGTLEPRKNVPALIRAITILAGERASTPVLVLAGPAGWDATIDGEVAAVPAGVTILRPGYIPRAELPAFLSASVAFVYPSLGEGFGLPVLEAMASGAYVVTTSRLALPEVGGDAVEYTDIDAASIAAAIGKAIDDPDHNAALREAAIARARTFTWAASAEVHITAYGVPPTD